MTQSQLCDGLGISLHGHGASPAAGPALSLATAGRVADLGRIPITHLTHALPHLVQDGTPLTGPTTARRQPVERQQQAVRACTMCVRHHSHGSTDATWIHRPWHQLVCVHHHQAAPDPQLPATLYTGVVPELAAAHHAHQHLKRHTRSASAWMAAHATTTRWYDHQQHLTGRWHHRLHQLISTNPQLHRAGNASARLLARDLVTYPETITLARTLTTLPDHHSAHPTRISLSMTGQPTLPRPVLPPPRATRSTPTPEHAPDQAPVHGHTKQSPLDTPFHQQQTQHQSHTPTKSLLNTPNNQTEHPPQGSRKTASHPSPHPQIPTRNKKHQTRQPHPPNTQSPVTNGRKLTVGSAGHWGR